MNARPKMSLGFRTLVIAMASAAMVVTGCGGDDESADVTTTSEATTSEATELDADDSSDGSGADVPTGGSGGFSSEECAQLTEAFENSEMGAALDGSTDPTAQLEEVAEYLRDAADDVPEAISADVAILADVYGQLAEASANVDWEGLQSGNPAAAAGAAELGQIYAANPEYMTATQNLATWVGENCTPAG